MDQLKMKLQTIQVDFDNSEAVQQDFVKLSQSLQVRYVAGTRGRIIIED